MYLLALILLLADVSHQHSISWMKTPSSPWLCGLVKDRDKFILYSRISMGSQNDVMDRAKYEIKKHNSSYEQLCNVDLKDCKGYSAANCYCNTLPENYVVDVVINMTATAPDTGATLKGTLYSTSSSAQIPGDEITLPVVYDISRGEAILSINDESVNIKQCDVKIKGNTAIIVLRRPANINVPYTLKVMDKADGKLIKNSTNALAISVQVDGHKSLTLSYGVSYLQDSVKKFDCNIHSEDECEETKTLSDVFLGLFLLFLIIIIAAVVIVIVLRFKFGLTLVKKSNRKSNNAEELIPLTTKPDYTELDLSISNKRFPILGNRASVSLRKRRQSGRKMGETVEKPLELVKNLLQDYKVTKCDLDKPLNSALQCQLKIMVELSVSATSKHRPHLWPQTDLPYPKYVGDNAARLGLGRIVSVRKFTKDSKEKSLIWNKLHSKLTSSEWIEVTVLTSRHVVFDDTEAERTTCRMLVNDDKVTFNGRLVKMVNIMENWSLLACTCDKISLFDVIQKNIDEFNNDWLKLTTDYKQYKIIKGTGFILSLPRVKSDETVLEPIKDESKETPMELSKVIESKETPMELSKIIESKERAGTSKQADSGDIKEETQKAEPQEFINKSEEVKPADVIGVATEVAPTESGVETSSIKPINKKGASKKDKKEVQKESRKEKKDKSKKENKLKKYQPVEVEKSSQETESLLVKPMEIVKDSTSGKPEDKKVLKESKKSKSKKDKKSKKDQIKETVAVERNTQETESLLVTPMEIVKDSTSGKPKDKKVLKESKKSKSKKDKKSKKEDQIKETVAVERNTQETEALLVKPMEVVKDSVNDEPEETNRGLTIVEPKEYIQSSSKGDAQEIIKESKRVEQKENISKTVSAGQTEITEEPAIIKHAEDIQMSNIDEHIENLQSSKISEPKDMAKEPKITEMRELIKNTSETRLLHKVNSHTANDQMVIYIERNSENFFYSYQKKRQLPYNPKHKNTYWELSSLPLVIQFTDSV